MAGENRVAVDLTGVSETLLIPLYAQWRENRRRRPVLQDPKVDEIVERLGVSFAKFMPSAVERILIVLRKKIIDRLVADHLRRHAGRAAVINLGCGLCSRFDRLDDGKVTWIDIDLAAVEPIWHEAFAGHDSRRRFVRGSVEQADLFDTLAVPQGGVPIVILEGVSMYLSEDKMRDLAARIAARFPGATFVFDILASWIARGSALYPSIAVTGARFTWGLDKPKTVESWGPGWRLIEDVSLARHLNAVYGPLGWLGRLNPVLRSAYRVLALKLGR
ncbi:class I SAM-dependent methyltransferase [Oleomonas cavernae]|uniref:Class I SAM-dependent methyltransferase n=1 Tax=Oleomonas cavernae TaxID=2320859 RepID=A0A418WDK8_9PROT|nr:class I SAM-dependent methyltransferase [Oleomonas cavernae]